VDPVGVPVGAAEQVLDAVGRLFAGSLYQLPDALAFGVGLPPRRCSTTRLRGPDLWKRGAKSFSLKT
jgi:hypothetical protein